MQSVWFELLDMLQDATILPHQFWISGVPACNHAKDFILYTTYFRKLTKDLIAPRDVSISDPLMTPMNLVGGLFPGKSGLKSWQQFLYKDSPGFNVPKSKRVYLNAAPNTTDHTAFDMHIPRGGLALLDSHTKRLRELTKKVYKVRVSKSCRELYLTKSRTTQTHLRRNWPNSTARYGGIIFAFVSLTTVRPWI